MKTRHSIPLFTAALFASACLRGTTFAQAAKTDETSAKSVLSVMQRAADWQLANPSRFKPTDWTQGAGYAGIMALAGISPDAKYRDSMVRMGEANAWNPGPRVYHADDHCVSQTYAELYFQLRDPKMIAASKARFDDILANPHEGTLDFKVKGCQDRWSWCDTLFMAPPAWLRMHVATGDKRYLDLSVNHWWRTSDYLYDKEEHLYFRDSTYFEKREANGKKVFWGRGNGWVIGGLVRMLEYLPSNHPERKKFEKQFVEMCTKLLSCQQDDGMWRASLLDPASYPLKETSGSSFYTYGFAWGVNQGLLDRKRFEPAARKGWAALTACVAEGGKLTHVQPVGADPKAFAEDSTEIYGVGAFLLAGSEIYRMEVTKGANPVVVSVKNPGTFSRTCETVDVSAPSEGLVVMDALTSRILDSQVIGKRLLFQVDLAPGETRNYLLLSAKRFAGVPQPIVKTHARFVPERLDDFAWESDRIAHRTYGPAIIKDPKEHLVSSGVDVWLKSVRYPVIDKWYQSGDYHEDKGEGLDNYKVGPARGCGGTAVWVDGKPVVSSNFTKWKVIADGPIRSEFELTFDSWDAGGRKVSEVKHMSIDAGSNFTRVSSNFTSSKAGDLTIGVGIIKRPGDAKLKLVEESQGGWMSYWEPEQAPNGHTACAVVVPGAKVPGFGEDDSNNFILGKATPGKPFVYYFGAGWSKSGDFPDAMTWEAKVGLLAKRLKSPLVVTLK